MAIHNVGFYEDSQIEHEESTDGRDIEDAENEKFKWGNEYSGDLATVRLFFVSTIRKLVSDFLILFAFEGFQAVKDVADAIIFDQLQGLPPSMPGLDPATADDITHAAFRLVPASLTIFFLHRLRHIFFSFLFSFSFVLSLSLSSLSLSLSLSLSPVLFEIFFHS